MKQLLWMLLLVAALVPSAAGADGLPVLGIDDGYVGVAAPGGDSRWTTIRVGNGTLIARISTADGQIVDTRTVAGRFTIPAVAYDGSAGGLSADGKTLVLIRPRATFPQASTKLMLVDASRLHRPVQLVELRGDFSYDAISPRGRLLYLIQYIRPDNPNEYLVRAYDLRARHLLPKPVVDPHEPGEKMRGRPITRAASSDGRWAYTLYDGAGSTPFVHALDTATGSARCIDLDAIHLDPNLLRLGLSPDGSTLAVKRGGRAVAGIDTHTFEVSAPARPATGSSFPWLLVVLSCAGAFGAAALGVAPRRRSATVGEAPVEQLPDVAVRIVGAEHDRDQVDALTVR